MSRFLQDSRKILAHWDTNAHTRGWMALRPARNQPATHCRQFGRYDVTGSIWLLRGRPVIALTETAAAIHGDIGVLVHRKLNKPALGPVGNGPDDTGAAT